MRANSSAPLWQSMIRSATSASRPGPEAPSSDAVGMRLDWNEFRDATHARIVTARPSLFLLCTRAFMSFQRPGASHRPATPQPAPHAHRHQRTRP